MIFEETTRSLFPADLFIQPGDQPPIVNEDLTSEMLALYRAVGIFAHEKPVRQVVDRVAKLDPEWIHPMPVTPIARVRALARLPPAPSTPRTLAGRGYWRSSD
jgi:hypothetical protein